MAFLFTLLSHARSAVCLQLTDNNRLLKFLTQWPRGTSTSWVGLKCSWPTNHWNQRATVQQLHSDYIQRGVARHLRRPIELQGRTGAAKMFITSAEEGGNVFSSVCLLSSTPSLGVYYFLSLTLSVCMSVCLSVCQKHCFFFFVSRWNRAISWPSILHDKNYKTLFFDSWFLILDSPHNAQNLLPKISTKSPISMADRPEMFGPTRGFSRMADSMEPCKMLWADPWCHGNEIWVRRGDPVAYRLVCLSVG